MLRVKKDGGGGRPTCVLLGPPPGAPAVVPVLVRRSVASVLRRAVRREGGKIGQERWMRALTGQWCVSKAQTVRVNTLTQGTGARTWGWVQAADGSSAVVLVMAPLTRSISDLDDNGINMEKKKDKKIKVVKMNGLDDSLRADIISCIDNDLLLVDYVLDG
ncbi:uncharacterized protein A4U43_C07F26350 [Asparagus officinalis]|uniref:Uncharacterized protein n=1 Tax=Asparagus officinalis TaxID=4686 RepID=A0A5P1EGZ1_ASPOF|nr:uncharacterized protein A4U43_C07F26350 [Asparagus officinalis]